MADPNNRRTEGAPPTHIHVEKTKTNWLAWLLLGLGLLALLLALGRCAMRDNSAAVTPTDSQGAVVATTPNAGTSQAIAGVSTLGTYLSGNATAPQRFVFEKMNFDTANSDVRADDAAEIGQIAGTLKQYPGARIRVAGYADSRGSDAANMALGKARADAIKSALVGQGVDGARIETVSGGEADPVDTNATNGGRFENRRAELVVTSR